MHIIPTVKSNLFKEGLQYGNNEIADFFNLVVGKRSPGVKV